MVIVEMKKHFQLRAIEWLSASVMTSWGVWVLLFPSMFLDNPACHSLLILAPQRVWGLVALAAGVIRLIALFVNGMWHRTPAIRWLTAMFSILVWFLVTAALTTSHIVNMGTIMYGWYIIADMYSAFRSASDYIEAEAQRKLKDMSLVNIPTPPNEDNNVHRLHSR